MAKLPPGEFPQDGTKVEAPGMFRRVAQARAGGYFEKEKEETNQRLLCCMTFQAALLQSVTLTDASTSVKPGKDWSSSLGGPLSKGSTTETSPM